MAQPIVTPENLAQAVEEIKQAAGGGSGDSNFVYIDSYIKKDTDDDNIPHLYIVIDSSIDLSDVTLRYCRMGRVRCRKSNDSPYHNNEEGAKAHTTGWHQVWRLPLHTTKTSLFVPIFASNTPAFTIGGNAYYEITVNGYDNFYEFATSEFSTGYNDENADPISIATILKKKGGVCLIKDGKQISNYAIFRTHYKDEADEWYLGK